MQLVPLVRKERLVHRVFKAQLVLREIRDHRVQLVLKVRKD
jgi:hypothetical protein